MIKITVFVVAVIVLIWKRKAIVAFIKSKLPAKKKKYGVLS